LIDGSALLVADAQDLLQRRTVRVLWGDEDRIVVEGGVLPGDRIVVSKVVVPIEGMPLRTRPWREAETATPVAPVASGRSTDEEVEG
jgi:multidrug efflux pump subunit AcrA (membrane-fusion protein)